MNKRDALLNTYWTVIFISTDLLYIYMREIIKLIATQITSSFKNYDIFISLVS